MYISPNSDIYILQDVPLDNTYTDTIYFSNVTAQHQFFLGGNFTFMHFAQNTYVRPTRQSVKVEVLADNIYHYNYMVFRNTAYGTKWFYAFITNIEYINDHCTQIDFEIDVMQTWITEVQLEPSLVEREHSATDNIGENIASEQVDLGRIICDHTVETEFFDAYHAVIASASNSTTGG